MKLKNILFRIAFGLAAIFALQSGLAQAVISSNRFLFIVETSRAMKQQLSAAVQSMQELLGSGLSGQLRRGDTLGLWTYDSELHAGLFPMQIWADENRAAIAEAAGGFLGQQKPKGKARLTAVLPDMLRLLEESQAITVLLFSDGSQPMVGTPFDDSINDAFKLHREELRAAHLPFVTVLVGRAGKIVKCSMNSSVGVSVPVLPLPEEATSPVAGAPTIPAATSPRLQPVKTNASLIVDFSKSNKTTMLVGGARTREVFSGVPMVKGDETNPEKSVYVQPRVLIEPPAIVETNPPPAVSSVLTTEVQTVTSAAPVVSPPEPPAVVKTLLPPLIVVYTRTNEVVRGTPAVPEREGNNLIIGVGVLGVLLAAGAAIWGMVWGSRSRNKGSLITKSLDREKK